MHPPPELLGRKRVELVVQTPVHADYALRLEAMLADVVRERIDFRRPSWVIVRVRSEMREVDCGIMDVHGENKNGRGTKKDSSKSLKVFPGELRV